MFSLRWLWSAMRTLSTDEENTQRSISWTEPTVSCEYETTDEDVSFVSDVDHFAEEEEEERKPFLKRIWGNTWKTLKFEKLPPWLQDNEYLTSGHRPQLPSLWLCFNSITALHSETGNIWTHMYGCIFFIGSSVWFFTRPSSSIPSMEKLFMSPFFLGAVLCLGLSAAFHTLYCHSPKLSGLFSKLDYAGISLLIVGSFIPWLFFAFQCRPQPKIIYICMISILGIAALVVSLWDKFAEPKFRPVRMAVFVTMGLSAVAPAVHLFIVDGVDWFVNYANLIPLSIMGGMYLCGAALYALRIPERYFPGKCDIWFQSHQLFHLLVVGAAFVHFYGITDMGVKYLDGGSCAEQLIERFGEETHPSTLGGWFGIDEDESVESWSIKDMD